MTPSNRLEKEEEEEAETGIIYIQVITDVITYLSSLKLRSSLLAK